MWSDIQYSLRMIRNSPWISFVAILALGLGIGLVSSQFTFFKDLVIGQLPFENSKQLFLFERHKPGDEHYMDAVPLRDLQYWRKNQKTFESLSGFYQGTVNIKYGDFPIRYNGGFMSSNFLDVLRKSPILGHGFPEDSNQPGSERVILLSYQVWKRDFGADPNIVGQKLMVNSEPARIIGVMPEGFAFPVHEEVWMPYQIAEDSSDLKSLMGLVVFGRIHSGSSLDQAREEFSTLATQVAESFEKDRNPERTVTIKPYVDEFISKESQNIFIALMVLVCFVLLIACANVANLMVARSSLRTRELAIRVSLGASKFTIIRQVVLEGILIASIGAVFGVIVSLYGHAFLLRGFPLETLPFWVDMNYDWGVLLFTVAITLISGFLCALIPAIQASGTGVNEVLKESGRSMSSLHMGRISRTLVVLQICISCFLLTCTVFMYRSLRNQTQVDLGYEADRILTARLGLFEDDYPDDQALLSFVDNILEKMRQHPQIIAASITDKRIDSFSAMGTLYEVEGQSVPNLADHPFSRMELISEGYFETLDIPVIGREFDVRDDLDSQRVVIVNESFAQAHWPDESPIGKRLRIASNVPGEWSVVIGVVEDLKMEGFLNPNEDGRGFYMPLRQKPLRFMTLQAHLETDPSSFIKDLRQVVYEVDPGLPLYWVYTIEKGKDLSLAPIRVVSILLGLFSCTAIILSCIGILGVMSFTVNQKQKEIGIRIVHGASSSNIVSWVLSEGLQLLFIGLTIGMVLAVGCIVLLSMVLPNIFFQTSATDPIPYLMVTGLITLVALISYLVPAIRGARVNLLNALRYE